MNELLEAIHEDMDDIREMITQAEALEAKISKMADSGYSRRRLKDTLERSGNHASALVGSLKSMIDDLDTLWKQIGEDEE